MKRQLRLGKIIFLVFFLMGNLFTLSGCGFKDIDKRVFILAVGVDPAKNKAQKYRITLKFAIPAGSLKESTKKKYSYLTYESKNITDGIRKLKTNVDKEFDFAHMKSLLIGEELLEQNLDEVIDLFVRRRDIQEISWVAVGRPSAEKVLKTEPTSEMAGSVSLFNFFSNNGVESPYIITTYLFDFIRRMHEGGLDPILPVIKADEEKTKLMVNRSIAFNDVRKTIELSPHQTKLFNLLANRANKMELVIYKGDTAVSVSIDSMKAKYKLLTPEKKAPVIRWTIEMAGIVEESDTHISAKNLNQLTKTVSQEVEKWIMEFLTYLQENKADPLGFGLRYKATRVHNRDTFKEWRQEIYPKLTYDVNVKVGIKSTGIIE
jgi:spore germination protein KC